MCATGGSAARACDDDANPVVAALVRAAGDQPLRIIRAVWQAGLCMTPSGIDTLLSGTRTGHRRQRPRLRHRRSILPSGMSTVGCL